MRSAIRRLPCGRPEPGTSLGWNLWTGCSGVLGRTLFGVIEEVIQVSHCYARCPRLLNYPLTGVVQSGLMRNVGLACLVVIFVVQFSNSLNSFISKLRSEYNSTAILDAQGKEKGKDEEKWREGGNISKHLIAGLRSLFFSW